MRTVERLVAVSRYEKMQSDIFKCRETGLYYSDKNGDYWSTIEEAVKDAQDTMKQKWNGTYYPSAQEMHNERMERIYG